MTRYAAEPSRRDDAILSLTDLDGFEDLLTALGLDGGLVSGDRAAPGANLLPPNSELGHLSVGLPAGFLNCSPFVADRLYWFPAGRPRTSSVFIASSRLRQDLERLTGWFDAIRTFGCRADPTSQFLVTAEDISTNRFVKRIGELFKIPVCEFKLFPKNQSLTALKNSFAGMNVCFFSRLNGDKSGSQNKQGDLDRLLMLAAEQVRLLSIRGNGNTAQAAQQRIGLKLDTRVLVDRDLTSQKKLNGLLEQGVTGWCLYDAETTRQLRTRPKNYRSAPILDLDEVKLDDYLIHWTRRRVGHWPDQAEAQYLDDLIFGSLRANHDPLAALCRILATERIMASNDLTRGQSPVVCLSEVRVDHLAELRVFRTHLARWDGLPFGVAIERETLQKHGARRVIYGNELDWESLTDELKPFFQMEKSSSGKIDWRAEKEWRIAGDLDLRRIGNQQAFVFVPTHEAAEVVSPLSRWPVVVLSTD